MTILYILGGIWAVGSLAFIAGLGVAASRRMPLPGLVECDCVAIQDNAVELVNEPELALAER